MQVVITLAVSLATFFRKNLNKGHLTLPLAAILSYSMFVDKYTSSAFLIRILESEHNVDRMEIMKELIIPGVNVKTPNQMS